MKFNATFSSTPKAWLINSVLPALRCLVDLSHETPTITLHYVEAELAMKDQALARLRAPTLISVATTLRTRCWSF